MEKPHGHPNSAVMLAIARVAVLNSELTAPVYIWLTNVSSPIFKKVLFPCECFT